MGHETGCTDQSSMVEVITDYFTLPTLDNELELEDFETWTTMMVTSVASLLQTLADRTMRELSELNAAGKKNTISRILKKNYNINNYLTTLHWLWST